LPSDKADFDGVINIVNKQASKDTLTGREYQDLLQTVKSARKDMKQPEKLDGVYDALEAAVDSPAYRQANASWAKFQTIQDALRRSSGAAKGVLDPSKLEAAVERAVPGGVIRNRSEYSDLVRAASLTKAPKTLIEEPRGLLTNFVGPALNSIQYARWNNPVTRQFMDNPASVASIEDLIKYAAANKAKENTSR
jgi:hypothetical protein